MSPEIFTRFFFPGNCSRTRLVDLLKIVLVAHMLSMSKCISYITKFSYIKVTYDCVEHVCYLGFQVDIRIWFIKDPKVFYKNSTWFSTRIILEISAETITKIFPTIRSRYTPRTQKEFHQKLLRYSFNDSSWIPQWFFKGFFLKDFSRIFKVFSQGFVK